MVTKQRGVGFLRKELNRHMLDPPRGMGEDGHDRGQSSCPLAQTVFHSPRAFLPCELPCYAQRKRWQ